VIEGDLSDADSLRPAFSGVDTLFLVSPNPELETQAVEVARAADVRTIVKSSALASGAEPPAGHRAVEVAIERAGVEWTFIRPSAFMQTLAAYLPMLVGPDGTFAVPAADGRTGWVDTRDIAAVACAALTEPGHDKQAYAVTGPEALSMSEVASRLSKAVGREIRYRPVSEEEARETLRASALPSGMDEFLVAHYRAVARGELDLVTDVVERVGHVDPRPLAALFEEHADDLAQPRP
jgi:uncharacterized protein YbjT (DUF2867 family)